MASIDKAEIESIGADGMSGAELFLEEDDIKQELVFPEEQANIPCSSANNNLHIKSEGILVDASNNEQNTTGVAFAANNDPLNIKSEDINATVVEESIRNQLVFKPQSSENDMVGAIIEAEGFVKKECEMSIRNQLVFKPQSLENDMVGEIIEAEEFIKKECESVSTKWNSSSTSSATDNVNIFAMNSRKSTCEICGLSFKKPIHLKRHSIIHKSPSEVCIYECKKCPFQTRHKASFTGHSMNVHSNPLELKKYSCEKCNYNTNIKNSLKRHLIRHHSHIATVESVKKEQADYMCSYCEFKTKTKSKYKSHLETHKEVNKCPLCPYQTKYSSSLYSHMLTHKSSTEIPLFKCELCSYESKWRHCLRNHIKVHEKKSEHVTIRKCEICEFTTNNIYSLEVHMKSHKLKPDKPKKMYTCYNCGYQSKEKGKLIRHMVVHKSSWQLELLQCDMCGFRTKTKDGLRNHILFMHGPQPNVEIKPNF